MEKLNNSKYIELKRKIYLVIFPILLITNASYLLISPYADSSIKIFIPLLCTLIAITCYFFYINRFLHTCEIIILIAFGLYHLNRVNLFSLQLEEEIINIYIMWSPFYYIYIFMVLGKKKALGYSLLIFLMSIGISIPYFVNAKAIETLIQYYASTLICILLLFFFQKITSIFIESELLRKYAFNDTLTNIGNRRAVDTRLENEMKRCEESNESFSIIYFDIDHFKQINDTYGHDIGDYVLKEFTSLLKSTIQPSDFLGRWGGEEFIIITTKSLTPSFEYAEKLREMIDNHSFNYVDHVTSSFGVTTYQPNDTPKSLIKRADLALYEAKNSGRNAVKVN